ncbi:hypothetical protein [Cohnella soli]|uniref:Uncharacterized protein n=1 Tax=Cohnella soli TaxID=425005 RepID=A0ABW0HUH2_9BACL
MNVSSGDPERLVVTACFCGSLQASEEMCGQTDAYSYRYLEQLERLTAPE